MWRIAKLLVVLIVVVGAVWVGSYNMAVLRYQVEFVVPGLSGGPQPLPPVSLWTVFAALFLGGAVIMAGVAMLLILSQQRALRRARRRIANLEGEVVAYRGRAAQESERAHDEKGPSSGL